MEGVVGSAIPQRWLQNTLCCKAMQGGGRVDSGERSHFPTNRPRSSARLQFSRAEHRRRASLMLLPVSICSCSPYRMWRLSSLHPLRKHLTPQSALVTTGLSTDQRNLHCHARIRVPRGTNYMRGTVTWYECLVLTTSGRETLKCSTHTNHVSLQPAGA